MTWPIDQNAPKRVRRGTVVAAALGTIVGVALPEHLAAKAQTVLEVLLKLFVSW